MARAEYSRFEVWIWDVTRTRRRKFAGYDFLDKAGHERDKLRRAGLDAHVRRIQARSLILT